MLDKKLYSVFIIAILVIMQSCEKPKITVELNYATPREDSLVILVNLKNYSHEPLFLICKVNQIEVEQEDLILENYHGTVEEEFEHLQNKSRAFIDMNNERSNMKDTFYLTLPKVNKQFQENYLGDKVDYWGGATVSSGNNWGQGAGAAVTLSSFITGGNNLKADPHNSLFQHEYGHYLQSQSMGFSYLSRVGIPSLMSTINYDDKNHIFQPYEQDANLRAFMYFNENVDGFYQTQLQNQTNRINGIEKGWNFWKNPLDVNHIGPKGENKYYDYYNPSHRTLIERLSLKSRWFDYLDPFGLIIGTVNGIYYNKHRI